MTHAHSNPIRQEAPSRGGISPSQRLVFVALAGVAISVAIFAIVRRLEETSLKVELERITRNTANLIGESLSNNHEALFALRSLFQHSDDVTRIEFEGAATELIRANSGLSALMWAPHVSAADRNEFEATAQARGVPHFRLSPPPADGADMLPLLYCVPPGAGPCAQGFDLKTFPFWSDLQTSIDDAQLRALDTTGGRHGLGGGYLIALPVYLGGVPAQSAERHRAFRGFVLGVFEPAAVLEHVMNNIAGSGIDLLLAEQKSDGELEPLYFRPSTLRRKKLNKSPSVAEIQQRLHHEVPLPFANRTWVVVSRPSPEWVSMQRSGQDVTGGVIGLLCTATAVIYLRSALRRTVAIEQRVAERTAELVAVRRSLEEDIRRRDAAERALKSSEERYRTFVSQSADAIWRLELPEPVATSLPVDEQVRQIVSIAYFEECNENTAQMCGRPNADSVVGTRLIDLSAESRPPYEDLLRAFVRSGYRLANYERESTPVAGKSRVFHDSLIGTVANNGLTRIWGTTREVTAQREVDREKRAFERRLQDTQRLESLGVLAGGIAHDFNNLLTGILGHASLARAELDPSSPLTTNIEQIERASQSAANLCQQMLAYAGKGRFVVKRQDISRIVAQTTNLLQVSIGKQAELQFQLADDLPPVMADGTQLQQIVMNLVINAAEAIGDRAGRIVVKTGLIRPDQDTFAQMPFPPEVIEPAYVYLEVNDSGCGMSSDVRDRIFEPFFTTKFSGRGLGLAATLGIVRSHRGALRVDSRPGEGSTFTVYLPAAEPGAIADSGATTSQLPNNAEGLILIVDDEAPVRAVAERMAKTLGLRAIGAPDGASGVELLRTRNAEIRLVLVDLTMPGLSGAETVRMLRSLAPSVKILIMSGYNLPDMSAAGIADADGFISKPFNLSGFRAAVLQALKPV